MTIDSVTTLHLLISTARHRYIVRRNDLLEVRLFADLAMPQRDAAGRPYALAELGPLLDPADHTTLVRRRALVVPLRRRVVALLVDQVDSINSHVPVLPLPALLQSCLRQPWANGVLLIDEQPLVQIDIRAIAMSYIVRAS